MSLWARFGLALPQRNALWAWARTRSLLQGLEVLRAFRGRAFRIPFPGFNPRLLSGPSAAHALLVDHHQHVTWRSEGDPVARLLGRGLLVVDGSEHDALREKVAPWLHPRFNERHLQIILKATNEVVDSWEEGRAFDVIPEMRRIALVSLMESLFGVDVRADLPRIWQPILQAIEYISPGWWLLMPGLTRSRFAKPLTELDGYLYEIIEAARSHPPSEPSLLTALIEDHELDDERIRDQLLTLLIAGHDTNTALLSWCLALLGGHPEILEAVRGEVADAFGKTTPTAEGLPRLSRLTAVIYETLRMFPPIHLGSRVAAQPFNIDGCQFAPGDRLAYSIYLTHRDPESWEAPDRFRPSRFDRRGTRSSAPPFAFLPFGGGPRNCIGAGFAMMEARAVLARVLQRTRLSPTGAPFRPQMGATLMPHPGVMMRLESKDR